MRPLLAWSAFLGFAVLGCNLAISLDDLQDGAGGTSSASNGPSVGPGATGATGTAATMNAASGSSTGSGAGGAALGYEECVAKWGPVLNFSLDAAGVSEQNLGSWAGSGTYLAPFSQAAALVANGDGAVSFGSMGRLDYTGPDFFGGFQTFSIEFWFRVPSNYSQDTIHLVNGTAGLFLNLQKRFDPSGDDFVRLRFRDTMGKERLITQFADLSEAGVPHHVVAVYRQSANTMFSPGGDADDLLLYLDGVPSPNPGSGDLIAMPALSGTIQIGNGFAGDLDELIVYPFELPASAVIAHQSLGLGLDVPCPAP